ncbi:MAG: sensor domain-containing diguanylate cyclase [Eubacteriales bacterium]
MDNNKRIQVSLLISLVILLGFIAMIIVSYKSYSEIIKDDILNISKLTATNIYSNINNEVTKPIYVSLTMANDSFLKDWLKDESKTENTYEHIQKLQAYLNGIKSKYGYDSVFLVSEQTKNYYHYQGINKTVSKSDEHDRWYYDFLDKNVMYELDVDTDEVAQNKLTVFINCRIIDEKGKVMGVTGVGLQMNHLQKLLQTFKDSFQLEALLINKEGVVQVHTEQSLIEKYNVFENKSLNVHKDKIIGNQHALEIHSYEDDQMEGYMISRYINELNWYLIVKKDTTVLIKSFKKQLIIDLIVFIVVILSVLVIVSKIFHKYQDKVVSMAKTDQLTNLLNRRGFNAYLQSMIKSYKNDESVYAYVFDIDNFKKLNDLKGHLFGDKVMILISSIASNIFNEKDKGVVSRWGGDEFAGFLYGERGEMVDRMNLFFEKIRTEAEFEHLNITVSIGITKLQKLDTSETLIYRADQSLYQAKASGKNTYVIS